jgi:hypothetical protein
LSREISGITVRPKWQSSIAIGNVARVAVKGNRRDGDGPEVARESLLDLKPQRLLEVSPLA